MKRYGQKMTEDEKNKKTPPVTVALAGNPNVGKSTVFNALTGMKQHTGNWAGKTVETACGKCRYEDKEYNFIDLPGCYSVLSASAEEEAAREFILCGGAEAVIVVCDSSCLERNLILALQICEIAPKTVVCLNLTDEAEKRGIFVDAKKLSQELGVPVAATSARSKKGLKTLMKKLDEALSAPQNPTYGKTFYEALGLFGEQKTAFTINEAERIANRCVSRKSDGLNRDIAADRILTGKKTAFPIMFLLLLGIFWLTVVGANYPSALLSEFFGFLQEKSALLFTAVNAPTWLSEPIINGIFATVGRVVSVMLPPMLIFFPLFTVLEDLGYLPRIAYNLDKCFQKCGSCGKQALTVCMGFGCNAVGVTGCRIIDSPRERLIAILTNSFVPCNGRFPAIIMLTSIFIAGQKSGFVSSLITAACLSGVVVLGTGMTLLMSKLLSVTILKGTSEAFTLELPPYRRPQILQIITRSIFDRTLFVLLRAVSVAAPAGLLIWLLANFSVANTSILLHLTQALDPFAKIFGLDGTILTAFILGFPANETVIPIALMAYAENGTIVETGTALAGQILIQNGWNIRTAVCFIIFSLFHWPCSTTLLTIKKETSSLKRTALAFILPTVTGLIVCFCVKTVFEIFGG